VTLTVVLLLAPTASGRRGGYELCTLPVRAACRPLSHGRYDVLVLALEYSSRYDSMLNVCRVVECGTHIQYWTNCAAQRRYTNYRVESLGTPPLGGQYNENERS